MALLTIDVGNSETAFGLFNNEVLVETWRITTSAQRTSDELILLINSLILTEEKGGLAAIDDICISSVVPGISSLLKPLLQTKNSIEVDVSMTANIKIDIRNPHELGSDRIANAVAAFNIFKSNSIIADFGTATTLDTISSEGVYLGGSISPGIGISAKALFKSSALLSQIFLDIPKNILGKDTSESIKSGIIYGSIFQTEGLAKQIAKELDWENRCNFITTGGYANIINGYSSLFNIHDPDLTLKGLKIIFDYYA